MNGWDEAKVKQVIGAPEDPELAVAVLVAVGYPEDARPRPTHPGRRPLAENVFRECLPHTSESAN